MKPCQTGPKCTLSKMSRVLGLKSFSQVEMDSVSWIIMLSSFSFSRLGHHFCISDRATYMTSVGFLGNFFWIAILFIAARSAHTMPANTNWPVVWSVVLGRDFALHPRLPKILYRCWDVFPLKHILENNKDWKKVEECIEKKISRWKGKHLSIGG